MLSLTQNDFKEMKLPACYNAGDPVPSMENVGPSHRPIWGLVPGQRLHPIGQLLRSGPKQIESVDKGKLHMQWGRGSSREAEPFLGARISLKCGPVFGVAGREQGSHDTG